MKRLLFLSGMALLVGCQAPGNIQQLQSQNQSLSNKLNTAQKQITNLQTEQNKLRAELKEAKRVIGVIDDEKSARITESTSLRGQVRTFVQNQIDSLKAFLVNSNLLDYIGGEPVRRQKYDNRPMMLVDLKNRVPQAGVLTGVGGYFVKPTKMVVKVLRLVNDKLVVVWESRPLIISRSGLVKQNFSVSVGVEKGDIIGYHFPKLSTVSFDEGTADTRYSEENLKLGKAVNLSDLSGKHQRRAYSLGVYALLK